MNLRRFVFLLSIFVLILQIHDIVPYGICFGPKNRDSINTLESRHAWVTRQQNDIFRQKWDSPSAYYGQIDYSRSEAEKRILEHYELYQIPAFIAHIKTFDSYRPYIKQLSQYPPNNRGLLAKVKTLLAIADRRHIELLATIHKLHQEIIEQEKKEAQQTQEIKRL